MTAKASSESLSGEPPTGVSNRAFARAIGVSEAAVRKAITTGRLLNSLGTTADGRIHIADLELAKVEWAAGSRKGGAHERAGGSAHGAHGPTAVIVGAKTLAEAQRLATIERFRKLRLENDVTEGRLVAVERVSKEAFESARTIRENVLNIIPRISGEVAAETDPFKVSLVLERAFREALGSVADRLEGAPVA